MSTCVYFTANMLNLRCAKVTWNISSFIYYGCSMTLFCLFCQFDVILTPQYKMSTAKGNDLTNWWVMKCMNPDTHIATLFQVSAIYACKRVVLGQTQTNYKYNAVANRRIWHVNGSMSLYPLYHLHYVMHLLVPCEHSTLYLVTLDIKA